VTKTVFDNGGYVGYKATFGTAIPVPVVLPSGLTLHVDAGDTRSYSGTGATWTDLSGSGNNMTLAGSPTFQSTNGGVLRFTTTQTATNPLNYQYSQNFTIISGSRLTGGANSRVVASPSTNWLFGHYSSYSQAYYANGWIHYSGTADTAWRIYAGTENYSANQRSFYVNNAAVVTNSAGGSTGFNGLSINSNPYGENSNCEVSFIAVWNRILTTTEMTSVYNAYKSRLGLT
jgi:hypothetical protein